MKSVIWLLIFWCLQIIANLSFIYGSELKSRWLICFVVGNTIGITSMLVLIKLYTTMPLNIALGLAMGGAFFLSQITVIIVFKTSVSLIQIIGILAIVLGMVLISLRGVNPSSTL